MQQEKNEKSIKVDKNQCNYSHYQMVVSFCLENSSPEVCRFSSPVSTNSSKKSMETEVIQEQVDAYKVDFRRILKNGMSNKGCFNPMFPTNPFLVGKNAEKMINELRQSSES